MEYLKLNSTKIILEIVDKNNGTCNWYSIVKTADQIENVEKSPPNFYVLRELIVMGYLKIEPSDGENSAKYFITEAGKYFLHSSDSLPRS